jgi:hypothetical protein
VEDNSIEFIEFIDLRKDQLVPTSSKTIKNLLFPFIDDLKDRKDYKNIIENLPELLISKPALKNLCVLIFRDLFDQNVKNISLLNTSLNNNNMEIIRNNLVSFLNAVNSHNSISDFDNVVSTVSTYETIDKFVELINFVSKKLLSAFDLKISEQIYV